MANYRARLCFKQYAFCRQINISSMDPSQMNLVASECCQPMRRLCGLFPTETTLEYSGELDIPVNKCAQPLPQDGFLFTTLDGSNEGAVLNVLFVQCFYQEKGGMPSTISNILSVGRELQRRYDAVPPDDIILCACVMDRSGMLCYHSIVTDKDKQADSSNYLRFFLGEGGKDENGVEVVEMHYV
eukprot:gene9770-12399_t